MPPAVAIPAERPRRQRPLHEADGLRPGSVRDVDHEVRRRNGDARQNETFRLFFPAQAGPFDRVRHRSADQTADTGTARPIPARARQTQIRKACGFENGERIGRFEGLTKWFDANQRRTAGVGHRVSR